MPQLTKYEEYKFWRALGFPPRLALRMMRDETPDYWFPSNEEQAEARFVRQAILDDNYHGREEYLDGEEFPDVD